MNTLFLVIFAILFVICLYVLFLYVREIFDDFKFAIKEGLFIPLILTVILLFMIAIAFYSMF